MRPFLLEVTGVERVLKGVFVSAGVGFIVACSLVACAAVQKERGEEDFSMRRAAYVDSVLAPAQIKVGEVLDVMISGNMPDPSWTLDRAEVERKDGVVNIIPWIRRIHQEPTMQVLVSFSQQVQVKELPEGHWEIRVESFGDDVATAAVEVVR
ncbi:MAG: hypothetical protein VKN33_06220 [Candidatus Sericytochromatia bacterium]|nr:hypothetical protein [Candidatus Sericytochromatia bacterium]